MAEERVLPAAPLPEIPGVTERPESLPTRPAPAWSVLWFVFLVAAEWVVLRFHYGDWRTDSPRITWLLEYGIIVAIGVGFFQPPKRFVLPTHWSVRAFRIIGGTLLCLVNMLLFFLTLEEALPEIWSGVDHKRVEVARLHGARSDVVVYHDAAREGVLVDAVFDVMVERHALPWQHKLLRMDGRYVKPTLERDGSGTKLVLTDPWKEEVVNVIDLDWE